MSAPSPTPAAAAASAGEQSTSAAATVTAAIQNVSASPALNTDHTHTPTSPPSYREEGSTQSSENGSPSSANASPNSAHAQAQQTQQQLLQQPQQTNSSSPTDETMNVQGYLLPNYAAYGKEGENTAAVSVALAGTMPPAADWQTVGSTTDGSIQTSPTTAAAAVAAATAAALSPNSAAVAAAHNAAMSMGLVAAHIPSFPHPSAVDPYTYLSMQQAAGRLPLTHAAYGVLPNQYMQTAVTAQQGAFAQQQQSQLNSYALAGGRDARMQSAMAATTAAAVNGTAMMQPPICKFYQQGQCTRGEHCNFLHIPLVLPSNATVTPVAQQRQASTSSQSQQPTQTIMTVMPMQPLLPSHLPTNRRNTNRDLHGQMMKLSIGNGHNNTNNNNSRQQQHIAGTMHVGRGHRGTSNNSSSSTSHTYNNSRMPTRYQQQQYQSMAAYAQAAQQYILAGSAGTHETSDGSKSNFDAASANAAIAVNGMSAPLLTIPTDASLQMQYQQMQNIAAVPSAAAGMGAMQSTAANASAQLSMMPMSILDVNGMATMHDQRYNYAAMSHKMSHSQTHMQHMRHNSATHAGVHHLQRQQLHSGSIATTQVSPMSEFLSKFTVNSPPEELAGHIYMLAKDQYGCRLLQRLLEEGKPLLLDLTFQECFPHLNELMTDSFGNYLCQKLIENCRAPEQRISILQKVAPDLVTIALNMHGTRAVQKLVETLSAPNEVEIVVGALKASVVTMIKDLNANHVIQRCLHHLSSKDNQFIYDAVSRCCVSVATHKHGCCVMQRTLDYATAAQRRQLVSEIVAHALELVQDAYGNYVVQYVLDLGDSVATQGIIQSLLGSIATLSVQKFSSNVVEKCFELAQSQTKAKMIDELLDASRLGRLLQDGYANYVIQKALNVAKKGQFERLVNALRPHLAALRNTAFFKRIQSKILKKFPELNPTALDTVLSSPDPTLPPLDPQQHAAIMNPLVIGAIVAGIASAANANNGNTPNGSGHMQHTMRTRTSKVQPFAGVDLTHAVQLQPMIIMQPMHAIAHIDTATTAVSTACSSADSNELVGDGVPGGVHISPTLQSPGAHGNNSTQPVASPLQMSNGRMETFLSGETPVDADQRYDGERGEAGAAVEAPLAQQVPVAAKAN